MNRHIKFVMASVFAMLVSPAMNRLSAVDIYVTTWDSSYNSVFGKIDSNTGVYTNIGPSLDTSTLAWSPQINAFYTRDYNTRELRTIDTAGNLGSAIGTINSKLLGFSTTSSTLYGLSKTYFNSINTSTAAETQISPTPPNGDVLSLVAQNNNLYATYSAAGGHVLSSINPSNGAFTTITTYPYADTKWSNLVLASDDTTLYGISDSSSNPAAIYTINPSDGTLLTTVNISGDFGNGFGAAGIALSVPEPSTYALGAIATGILAAIARRRKACKA